MSATEKANTYGLIAEFEDPVDLVKAVEGARDAGYRKMNTFTPFPIEACWEAIGHRTPMSQVCLAGGLFGGLGGFAFLSWATVIAYPLNVGGRPLWSWPAYIPPTFELTILFAGLSAAIGMFLINGLPQPYHPVFNAPNFERASQDRYFLLIEAQDENYDRTATEKFLREFGPHEVSEVEE